MTDAGPDHRPGPPPAPGPIRKWWLGARPRTLPAALVPVVVGTAAAHPLHHLAVVVLHSVSAPGAPSVATAPGGYRTVMADGPAYGSTVTVHLAQHSPAPESLLCSNTVLISGTLRISSAYMDSIISRVSG